MLDIWLAALIFIAVRHMKVVSFCPLHKHTNTMLGNKIQYGQLQTGQRFKAKDVWLSLKAEINFFLILKQIMYQISFLSVYTQPVANTG